MDEKGRNKVSENKFENEKKGLKIAFKKEKSYFKIFRKKGIYDRIYKIID